MPAFGAEDRNLQGFSRTPHVSPQVWTLMPKMTTVAPPPTARSLRFGPILWPARAVESDPLRLVYTGFSPPSIGRLFFLSSTS